MNPFVLLAIAALVESLVVGALLTPLARVLGRRLGMIDHPGLDRKIHAEATPRSGGLAVFAAFWGCMALNLVLARTVVPGLDFLPERIRVLAANTELRFGQLGGIFVGCAIIFITGAIDDRRPLPPVLRLAIQILAVVPLLATGVVIKFFLPLWAGWILTIFWIVLLTNSLNFLDNMNGLTSGVAAIVAAVMALISALSQEYYMMLLFAMLAGACIGFWLHNFTRNNIFLGDNGSTHLGFLLGALTAVATYYHEGTPTRLPILMPVIVLGVPLFDTITVLWIRWRSGKPLMQGDRNHISHRLVDLGMTPREAVVFLYGVTLAVGLAAIVLRPLDWRYGLLQTALIAMLFAAIYWMERVSQRTRSQKGRSDNK
ncbi:undecaprenyl/decaprenyl-phosphate alpha-N-acetylglucosaminyl 1-phosphate transferase [bacterium]|nr:undecaprenyl/decaprenyl-phosphate alpha-N-acetylglucosaminyl 1-phosphate transferase [bacterium]